MARGKSHRISRGISVLYGALVVFALMACSPEDDAVAEAPNDAVVTEKSVDEVKTASEIEYHWPEQAEDVAHILSKGRMLEPVPLDLSDEREYRYYIQQLKLAGITPEFAPQFHKEIEAERERYKDPEYREKAMAEELAAMKADLANEQYLVSDVNVLTGVGNAAPSSNEVVSSGFSSVQGGTLGTHVTVSLYDASKRLIRQAVNSSPSGQGQFTEVATNGVSDSPSFSSSFLYTYVTREGQLRKGTVSAATDDITIDIVNTQPAYTRPGVSTGDIVACMWRNANNKADCDYWQPQGHEIILPVIGSMDFNRRIIMAGSVPSNGNVFFMLTHKTQGGGCIFPGLASDQFFQRAGYPTNSKITWSLNPQDFGQANACMPSGTTAIFLLSIQVNVDDGGTVRPLVGAISSSGASAANDNVENIPPIEILWGCLVKGSMIETVDGMKPVEEVVAQQDRVVINRNGDTSLVTGTVVGEEEHVIKLTTDGGKTISLTQHHPVIVAGLQVKLAREIGIGDEVMTRDGLETVTMLSRELYDDQVYNLVVEPADDEARERGSTLFADGFMVGDNEMQRIFETNYRARSQTIHASAPPSWRVDNENIIQRQKERAAAAAQ